MNNIDFSVIIPHRDSVHLLPRLFSSIPDSERIEVILVDNSPIPISPQQIRNTGVKRDFVLLFSSPERGAGGARNVGLENAHGKWLVFADADDYFADGAFDVFYEYRESDSDIVYFCSSGIYIDTGEYSSRAESYTNLVRDYLNGDCSEEDIKYGHIVPWSKMIKRNLVFSHHLMFDEIRAGNDAFFSMSSAYLAQNIEAVDYVSYIVTVSKGSLTKRRDYEVIKSRLYSTLHCNQFLKKIGCSRKQYSIMYALYESRHYGLKAFFEFCGMVISFRQNPLIGCKNWLKSLKNSSVQNVKDKRYIVR